MIALENYTAQSLVDYYVGYILEHDLAKTKSEARKLFLNALSYNVVRESVIEQVEFLIETDDE